MTTPPNTDNDDKIEEKILKGEEISKPDEMNKDKKSDDSKFITLVAMLGAFAIMIAFLVMINVWGNKMDGRMADIRISKAINEISNEQNAKIDGLKNEIRTLNEKVSQIEGDSEAKMRNEIDTYMNDPKAKAYMEKKFYEENSQ